MVTVCYARVSTYSQRDDFERQAELLRSKFPEAEHISEIGSGLNFRRGQFLAILDRFLRGDLQCLVVAHPDRLLRFAIELVRWLCEKNQCQLMVWGECKLSKEQELV
ncbi:recombinase family protein [Moorena sp. SIO1F2]|uniref:recombinase family protein n=1 Tax=Moorena sp. SIO1F2 TaxID=2607819 RepID=UPI0025EC5733|nr:recombinase family protein [Moorena sp. SIO1F2]